ncbi:MAG: TonB-dependent receptor, partial [Gammaproteobacteria bacterium]|nr:TonB-dependent receptor [Gammaproteobacteria bacterium]
TDFAEHERDNTGAYTLVQDKFGKHQLQLSGRADDNEAFGTHRTGNLAWSYDVNAEEQVILSHGTAFIAPTFNDLYYVDPYFNGNPDLDPETSRSTELGFTGRYGWGQWETRAYHTVIKNLIINVSTDPLDWAAPWTTVNANRAEINGMEFEVSGKTAGWDNMINLSLVDAKDAETGNQLQGRARHTLKMNIAKNFNRYRIAANLLAQSSRFADAANTVELAGYAVLNLMVERNLNKNWALKARLDNVLDKEYSTSTNFYGDLTNNTPVSLFVTLSYKH